MSQKCKLLPGDDTTTFVLNFNEQNFDVMCALERDELGGFGFVFFKRTEIRKISFIERIKRKIYSWMNI